MSNLYSYNTSTARKLNMDYFDYSSKSTVKTSERETVSKKTTSKAKTKAPVGIRGIVTVAIMFFMAFSVVNGYVSINEANNEIFKLKDEYNSIVASNQAIQVKIDKAIDLKQLQTVAGEKYGMVSPERYQLFYVDLSLDDFAEKTDAKKSEKEQGTFAISGVPGVITGTLNIFN